MCINDDFSGIFGLIMEGICAARLERVSSLRFDLFRPTERTFFPIFRAHPMIFIFIFKSSISPLRLIHELGLRAVE